VLVYIIKFKVKKMYKKYYVGIRAHTNGFHSVHDDECPFLPEKEKRIYLGVFEYPEDAVEESKKYFRWSDTCPFCSKERLSKKSTLEDFVLESAGNFVSSDRLSVSWESSIFCSVN